MIGHFVVGSFLLLVATGFAVAVLDALGKIDALRWLRGD